MDNREFCIRKLDASDERTKRKQQSATNRIAEYNSRKENFHNLFCGTVGKNVFEYFLFFDPEVTNVLYDIIKTIDPQTRKGTPRNLSKRAKRKKDGDLNNTDRKKPKRRLMLPRQKFADDYLHRRHNVDDQRPLPDVRPSRMISYRQYNFPGSISYQSQGGLPYYSDPPYSQGSDVPSTPVYAPPIEEYGSSISGLDIVNNGLHNAEDIINPMMDHDYIPPMITSEEVKSREHLPISSFMPVAELLPGANADEVIRNLDMRNYVPPSNRHYRSPGATRSPSENSRSSIAVTAVPSVPFKICYSSRSNSPTNSSHSVAFPKWRPPPQNISLGSGTNNFVQAVEHAYGKLDNDPLHPKDTSCDPQSPVTTSTPIKDIPVCQTAEEGFYPGHAIDVEFSRNVSQLHSDCIMTANNTSMKLYEFSIDNYSSTKVKDTMQSFNKYEATLEQEQGEIYEDSKVSENINIEDRSKTIAVDHINEEAKEDVCREPGEIVDEDDFVVRKEDDDTPRSQIHKLTSHTKLKFLSKGCKSKFQLPVDVVEMKMPFTENHFDPKAMACIIPRKQFVSKRKRTDSQANEASAKMRRLNVPDEINLKSPSSTMQKYVHEHISPSSLHLKARLPTNCSSSVHSLSLSPIKDGSVESPLVCNTTISETWQEHVDEHCISPAYTNTPTTEPKDSSSHFSPERNRNITNTSNSFLSVRAKVNENDLKTIKKASTRGRKKASEKNSPLPFFDPKDIATAIPRKTWVRKEQRK